MHSLRQTKWFIQVACLVLISSWLIGSYPTFAQTASTSNPIYLPLLARQFDPAWQWQQPQLFELSPDPNTSDPMLLTIDTFGQPHLLYDTLFDPRFIYHTYLTDQGWITPTQVADTLGISYTLFPPVVDDQGGIHLLWRNWLGSGVTNPYRLMYSKMENNIWSDEEEVYRSNSDIQGMVRPDKTGVLHVTSASTLFLTDIHHFTRLLSGWSLPVDISTSHSTTWIWPDYYGGVHFYGKEYYPKQGIVHSYWVNGNFQIEGEYIAGELPYGDSLLDGLNNLNIFRRDQVPVPGRTVYGVYYRCLTHDSILTDEQVLSGQQDTLSPLVKAEDGHAQIALAWQESTGNVVQVRIFEDCKLTHSSSITLPSGNSWELESAALSSNPGKFCLLARRSYTSTDYILGCALIKP